MPKDDSVNVTCTVLKETAKAIQIRDEGGMNEHWILLSCVNEIHRQDGWINIDRWIAEQKGLA